MTQLTEQELKLQQKYAELRKKKVSRGGVSSKFKIEALRFRSRWVLELITVRLSETTEYRNLSASRQRKLRRQVTADQNLTFPGK